MKKVFTSLCVVAMAFAMAVAAMADSATQSDWNTFGGNAFSANGKTNVADGIYISSVNNSGTKTVTIVFTEDAVAGVLTMITNDRGEFNWVIIDNDDFSSNGGNNTIVVGDMKWKWEAFVESCLCDINDHDWDYVCVDYEDATCTLPGCFVWQWVCACCGETGNMYWVEDIDTPALGHDWTITGPDDEYIVMYYCERCKQAYWLYAAALYDAIADAEDFLDGDFSDYTDASVADAKQWVQNKLGELYSMTRWIVADYRSQEEFEARLGQINIARNIAHAEGLLVFNNAYFLRDLSNANITAGLTLTEKTLTLSFGERTITLSTNANNKNQSGTIDIGDGYVLVFEIAGNGGNIKTFQVEYRG